MNNEERMFFMGQVTLDVYDLLKRGGTFLQFQINNMIQNQLNNYSLIELAKSQPKALAKKIKTVQKYTEQTATILNFPTKTDLSNATQLIIQSEEKIDNIEDQIYQMTRMLQEMKELVEKIASSDETNSEPISLILSEEIAKQEEEIASLQQGMLDVKQKMAEQKEQFYLTEASSDDPYKVN